MSISVRQLTAADREADLGLSIEAFGERPIGTPAPAEPAPYPPKGCVSFGAWQDDSLVAKVRCRDYESHLPDGRTIPTLGIAGVTVRAEERGIGLLSTLFDSAFARAREVGQPISTLYPTAPGIYRRFGYELVGALTTLEFTSSQLANLRPPEGISLRRATPADLDTLRALYTSWASDLLGPLTRGGPSEPIFAESMFDDVTAVTIAEDATGPVGCAWWKRGVSADPAVAVVEVFDLLAASPDAARALWRMLASFSSVAGRVRVETSLPDPVMSVLPGETGKVVDEHRYMLAILDVAAAFEARATSGALSATLPFQVSGGYANGVDGSYQLGVSDGQIACSRIESGDGPTFTARGLAALYGGALRCAQLRRAGLLSGPSNDDAAWDALCCTPTHIRDYF
ncbi:GNAT family N-acetyltransferase [Flexivirga sp. ID2601S]|uniref:GNAT family N-acetyltransferase n=1 Tax=Flexivirga aerilata TaxID=1656889 RepID=A0A849AGG7_9MICO|nr:GNAT family N-acetyltransferase [Flexivirga aerilata]NNG38967.1 GNAT family N-acetyltransferase [Flexivirga aerilata]